MIGRCELTALILSALAMSGPAIAQQAIDPSITLTAVEIDQRPPFLPTNVGSREILIRFRVAGPPSCASLQPPSYTLLLDAFPWMRSHVQLAAFPELRFQSAIAVRCDAAGRLISNIKGSVSVEPAPNAATITLLTTLDQLPAVEFRWIAVASNASTYTRAPATGKYARWVLYERTLR